MSHLSFTTCSLLLVAATGCGTIIGVDEPNRGFATPNAIATADFDADGRLDLVIANTTSNYLSLLMGHGDGSFAAPVTIPIGGDPNTAIGRPASVVTGDIDHDGAQDVIAGFSGTVAVILGNGDGSFGPRTSFNFGGGPLEIGQLNSDIHLDLLLGGSGGPPCAVAFGDGTGSFALGPLPLSTVTNCNRVGVADINGDARADVYAFSPAGPSVTIVQYALATGTAMFGTPQEAPLSIGEIRAVVAADVDRDGKLDFAGLNGKGKVAISRNAGDGTFTPASVIPVVKGDNGDAYGLVVDDLDRDGRADLIVTNKAGQLSVVRGADPAGTFAAAVDHDAGPGPQTLVLGDFDGNGHADIAVVSPGANRLTILIADGTGSFARQPEVFR